MQLQVYLIEAPRKAPPPLPGPEPEPEPEPQLHQTTPPRRTEEDEAEPLAGAIDRSSVDLQRVSASSMEAMTLASEIDRSSLDVLRVSASSMEAMGLSNSSSRCSMDEDAAKVKVVAKGGSAAPALGAHKQSHETEGHGTTNDVGSSASAEDLRNDLQQQEQAAKSCEATEGGDELRTMHKQLKTAEAVESDARP